MKQKTFAVAIYSHFATDMYLECFSATTGFGALVQAANLFFKNNEDAQTDISRLRTQSAIRSYFNNCDMEIAWKEVKPLKEGKQVEEGEGERPVIRSTAFYRNKEKTEDPPFNQLSRCLGTAVFQQLLNVLKPKESKPVERAKIDPGRPVYRIKPHVLSLPLLDPSTHARHHCLYTELDEVFRISGLAMWGISEDTTLNISIGGQVVFDGDVPAQMFANGLSFHELYQIPELKEPPYRIVSQNVSENLITKLRTNVKWRALEAGLIPPLKIHESLELNISGPAKYAVFWGYRRDLIHD